MSLARRLDTATEQFFRKSAALFFSGSPTRQYVKMLVAFAVVGGTWFYGNDFLDWLLRPPVSPVLEVIALLLALAIFCALIYLIVWLNIRRYRTVRTIADGAMWFYIQAQKARRRKAADRSAGGV